MEKKLINHTLKINLPGGIAATGELLEILKIAKAAGLQQVRFGTRQQLLLEVSDDELTELQDHFTMYDISYEVDAENYPNIISSYVTEDIIFNANWLKEGVYKDIIDLFDYQPRLKINLADNKQTFIPFFTGNLNFISADVSNFWYLYVRFPKTDQLYCWPSLIYTEDIPGISKIVEEIILTETKLYYDQPAIDGYSLFQKVNEVSAFLNQSPTQPLILPDFHLPFYEGFNRYGNQKQWLGIYRRTELFPVDFLIDICMLCNETRIGQLYTTPWKSVVIKGIEQADRNAWGTILNRHRINVRHAANELNWQVEDLCPEGLVIKRQLVKEFEEADTRTYRLCFAVKTRRKSGLFGSVIIKKQHDNRKTDGLFEILHTRDFNPNSKDFVVFKRNLQKNNIHTYLMQLCDQFYELQNNDDQQSINIKVAAEADTTSVTPKQVYQCKNCFTVYDEFYGDEAQSIVPGTKFETLKHYHCPVCDAPTTDFNLIDSLTQSIVK